MARQLTHPITKHPPQVPAPETDPGRTRDLGMPYLHRNQQHLIVAEYPIFLKDLSLKPALFSRVKIRRDKNR